MFDNNQSSIPLVPSLLSSIKRSIPKMVAISPIFTLISLLATPPNKRTRASKRNKNTPTTKNNDNRIGRRRYNRSGDKIQSRGNQDTNNNNGSKEQQQLEVNPLPKLTSLTSSRPTYFTCRHTYEDTLIDEINRFAKLNIDGHQKIKAYSPYPGLVRVEDETKDLPPYYDPVYALQSMPNTVVVKGDSIKNIATSILSSLLGDENEDEEISMTNERLALRELRQKLRSAQKGSLSIHALVPGMCKGQTKPLMNHRSEKVGEELRKILKKGYPSARKRAGKDSNDSNDIQEHNNKDERWLLQFMLQSNTLAVASLTKCTFVGPGIDAFWPNIQHPLGLANVDIEEKMPSSAYRKLMEGLECMQIHPSSNSKVVDLGACPGGWTSVVRKLGSHVTAIDRSKLDPALMNDEMVEFVKGDAFTFVPAKTDTDGIDDDTWMISDVIAYPERCTELLENWCEQQWARYMVVTMKFQGTEPALDELDDAIDIVRRHGYDCRVKHFFNNKNEVTLMITKASNKFDTSTRDSIFSDEDKQFLGKSVYKSS